MTSACGKANKSIASLLLTVTKELDGFDAKLKINDIDDLESHVKLQPARSRKLCCSTVDKINFVQNFLCVSFCLLMFFIFLLVSKQLYSKHYNSNSVHPVLTEKDEKLSLFLTRQSIANRCLPADWDLESRLDYLRSVINIGIVAPVIIEMPDFDRYKINTKQWFSRPFLLMKEDMWCA